MGGRGPGWLYPDRRRCLACRNYFGFLVIRRLYCSWKCAGMPTPPPPGSIETPRSCRLRLTRADRRAGVARMKQVYFDPREAQERVMPGDQGAQVYECWNCGMFHIGHERPEDEPELAPIVFSAPWARYESN